MCLAEEDKSGLPLAAKALKESFYLNKGLPSVETKQEAILLHHQRQDLDLFNRGGVKLHKWDSNSSKVFNNEDHIQPRNSDTFVKTLGME